MALKCQRLTFDSKQFFSKECPQIRTEIWKSGIKSHRDEQLSVMWHQANRGKYGNVPQSEDIDESDEQ